MTLQSIFCIAKNPSLLIYFCEQKLEMQEKILGVIKTVDDWCAPKKLTISSSKSKLMQFGTKTLSESSVTLVGDTVKCLGKTFDKDSILEFITAKFAKIAKLKEVINRARSVFSSKSHLQYYESYATRIISNCRIAYGCLSKIY